MTSQTDARTARGEGYDVVVIGSGFGGAVAALRLAEKGYSVQVLEAGRRFADADLPRTSWDVRRFLWAPALGCFGIQRIHLLPDVLMGVFVEGRGRRRRTLGAARAILRDPLTQARAQSLRRWRAHDHRAHHAGAATTL